jgi:hypothetical protein
MIPQLLIFAAAICAPQAAEEDAWEFLAAKYDKNQDGVITRKEYDRDTEHWKLLDTDGNSKLDRKEFEARTKGPKKGGPDKPKDPPKPGAVAPDFELDVLPPGFDAEAKQKDAKPQRVKLSSFRGKRPVALIFGSYT